MFLNKIIFKYSAISVLFAICFTSSFSQSTQTSCPNSDFSQGNFNNWTGFYRYFSDPDYYEGFDTGYSNPGHLIIGATGLVDTNTCGGLMTVPPGESFAARLGNDSDGGFGDQLRYTLNVTEESTLFIYKYAVVFEDPDHLPTDQPKFSIEVTDQNGVIFDSLCGYYFVYCRLDLPGWNICKAKVIPVVWRNWTTVGIDLSKFLGQTITIVFTATDCGMGAHYGYAYLSTTCGKLQIAVSYCPDDGKAILTAPTGFSYLWSNWDTTQTTEIVNPVPGSTADCDLTSVTGCKATIHAMVSPTLLKADFTCDPGIVNTETPFTDLSTTSQNFVAGWEWDFGDGTPGVTNVQNPKHTFTSSGIYNVRLIIHSTDVCSDTITKPVTIIDASVVIFPLAFTPNNDGLNDTFLPALKNIGQFHMSIYDRWGAHLFEADDFTHGWNGMHDGELCPEGVYAFIASCEQLDTETTKTYAGTFTLIR